jgi:hypothetical protein
MIIPPQLRRSLLELGRRPAARVPFAVVKRPHGIAAISAVLTRILPGVDPAPAVEPLKPILAGEVDDVATVGWIAELHPRMPEPCRLEKLLATRVGQCPTDVDQLAAVGSIQALKRLGRTVQLTPLRLGHLQHLFPSQRHRLAVGSDRAARPQRRDRRIKFLRIFADVCLRLRRR